ncbi:MAG: bifunctional folylpolyglutamate synthase/dihydrofolate synthase [Gammaproteobacteria bacterium]|nr:MAG: bifunctional folylpolyglutamate synthase/dihydrofolate synthase [Gammaproteobacteria bacterium]PIE36705.1 MAG: bifunctional folylpolyglutamate synthase/dihydrofolate synthase [Gammaproteobacteria bacterium]
MAAVTTEAAGSQELSLDEWLTRIEALHPRSIELGLDRIGQVAGQLGLCTLPMPLITVAGTNGKGSIVAMLESVYRLAGYRTGAYTSPHISDFRERIRVDGEWLPAARIVAGFEAIEAAREVSLTYFEYTTLAAMALFIDANCDVVILEVGLGGRLDATNLWDADVAVLASIALDHQDWLGNDLAVIATEKAGIGRRGRPLIVGEATPPTSLEPFARERGIDIRFVKPRDGDDESLLLPGPHQRRNAACARAAVAALQARLPVAADALNRGLQCAVVPGRFERREVAGVEVILDVAHNPAAASAVVDVWRAALGGKAVILYSSLADKDIAAVVAALAAIATDWHLFAIEDSERAVALSELETTVRRHAGSAMVVAHDTAELALTAALEHARASALPILVCGSFHALAALAEPLFDMQAGTQAKVRTEAPATARTTAPDPDAVREVDE